MKNLSPGPLNPKVKVRLPNVTAGPVSAPPLPVIILGIGIYLVWFGIRYFESDVAYPTTPVKDILQGKGLTPVGSKLTAQSIASANFGSAASSAAATPSGTGGGTGGYVNPLKGATVTPERIDQGVDYACTSDQVLGALAPSTIVLAQTNSGWPGGGWVSGKITSGPLAGRIWYIAETITPTVKAGQKVNGGDPVCTMHPNGVGIETGWASPGGNDQAYAHDLGQQAPGDPGAWSSAMGKDYSDLIAFLGGPPGKLGSSGTHGTNPPGWDSVALMKTAVTTTGGGTAQAGGGQAGWIAAFLADLGAPASAANLSSLNAWVRAESGNWGNSGSAHGNPFNIGPGKTYASDTAGAKATADLIASGYHLIYMHLKAGQGLLSGCAPDFAKWGTQTTGL